MYMISYMILYTDDPQLEVIHDMIRYQGSNIPDVVEKKTYLDSCRAGPSHAGHLRASFRKIL